MAFCTGVFNLMISVVSLQEEDSFADCSIQLPVEVSTAFCFLNTHKVFFAKIHSDCYVFLMAGSPPFYAAYDCDSKIDYERDRITARENQHSHFTFPTV